MADPDFFNRSGPFSLEQLADIASAELSDLSKSSMQIRDVASLDQAGEGQISFLDNIKYKDQFINTKAAACIVAPDLAALAPEGVTLLVTPTPYKAYALVAQTFYPNVIESRVSDDALIDEGAVIGDGSHIAAGAVIKAGAKIGNGSFIDSGAVIAENVVVGKNCRINANAVISHCIMGDHVHIYPGACIGQDGFGFAPDPAGFVKVPQLGRVIIGDSVAVGANATIDRGAGPDTVIGSGTWIDNLVQIAHNVTIGNNCIIIAQVGISGSTELGDFVVLAGQTGVAGHLKLGSGVRVGAQSGVMKDIPAGEEYLGSPAVPARQFMRQIAALKGLIKKKN